MIKVFRSRYTPNVCANDIDLKIGERVQITASNGSIIHAIIKSKLKKHNQCPNLGYECLTLDDNRLNFIDGTKISYWDGIVKTK